jgi:hypothetical protein
MANSFGLEISGPQEISGNGSTTFTFSGDIAPGGYLYGFSQLNLNAGEIVAYQQDFTISLSDNGGGGGNSVTVTQSLGGFNSSSSSYVTCIAVVASELPPGLYFANNTQTIIGAPSTTNPITPTAPPQVAVAALSGFSLSFSKGSSLDGIGASVGVSMSPADGSLAMLGTASLIGGSKIGIQPTSTVNGSALVLSQPSDEVGVYMQQNTGTDDDLWQYVLWNATQLGVFLQSFYLQFLIYHGPPTPVFSSLSVGGNNFWLGDQGGKPGFAQGSTPFTSSGFTDGYPDLPAQYQVANYLLIGVT